MKNTKTRKQVRSFFLTEDVHKRLKEKAFKNNRSIVGEVKEAISKHIK